MGSGEAGSPSVLFAWQSQAGGIVVLSIRAAVLHYDVFCNLAGRFGYVESSKPLPYVAQVMYITIHLQACTGSFVQIVSSRTARDPRGSGVRVTPKGVEVETFWGKSARGDACK